MIGIGQLLTATEVAQRLHISRSTFYTLSWFKRRAIRVSERAVRWRESDVALYVAHREGKVA